MLAVTYTPPAVNPLLRLIEAKLAGETAIAETLKAKSQPLVPVDTGALRDSATVTHDGDQATLTYSATSPEGYDYAAIQHERLDYTHTAGQAKYVEQPMNNEHEAMLGAAHAAMAPLL